MSKWESTSIYKPPQKVPFKLKLVRLNIKFLSIFWPSKCDKLLVKLFIHPRRDRDEIANSYNEKNLFSVGMSEFFDFEDVKIFKYQEGDPQVLLLPGWESSGLRFSDVMKTLRVRNIGFLFVDLPAQGISTGYSNNAVKTSRLIHFLLNKNPSIHSIIGHSFGGGSSFVALSTEIYPEPMNIKQLITVGSPTHYESIIYPFFVFLDVPTKMKSRFLKALSTEVGFDFTNYDLTKLELAPNVKIISFHDENDTVIPVNDAKRIKDRVELHLSRGLGHRKIMHDPKIVNQIVNLVDGIKIAN